MTKEKSVARQDNAFQNPYNESSQLVSKKQRRKRKFLVVEADNTAREIALVGRNAWALGELISAGTLGITALDYPGARIAAYVHMLRSEYGLLIETVDQKHDGPFAGTHAKYILKSDVIAAKQDAAA